jgi:hypothetical protein
MLSPCIKIECTVTILLYSIKNNLIKVPCFSKTCCHKKNSWDPVINGACVSPTPQNLHNGHVGTVDYRKLISTNIERCSYPISTKSINSNLIISMLVIKSGGGKIDTLSSKIGSPKKELSQPESCRYFSTLPFITAALY